MSEAQQVSQPNFTVTDPTPRQERNDFIDNASDSSGDGDFNSANDRSEIIDVEPRQQEMSLSPREDNESDFNPRSSYTLSEVGSGYDQDTNECSEFCLDFCACFGLLDACCPADEEGCVTSCAIFLGNVLFSCCTCK